MSIQALKDIQATKLDSGKNVSMQMLISPEIAPNFAMRKFTIAKGGFMPYHTNEVEHEQFVLKGSAKVVLEGKEFIAKKDDILFIPAKAAHSYEVLGDEDYEFLCLVPNKQDAIKMV